MSRASLFVELHLLSRLAPFSRDSRGAPIDYLSLKAFFRSSTYTDTWLYVLLTGQIVV